MALLNESSWEHVFGKSEIRIRQSVSNIMHDLGNHEVGNYY